MPKSWFEVRNAAAEVAEIYIYDVIANYGVSASAFITALNAVTAKKLTLRINSPGGEMFAGFAIFNAIQRKSQSGVAITACVDGVAASMASVIAMACDSIEMAENAMMMIHNPCGGACGESEDLRRAADVIDKLKQSAVAAYAKKTGLEQEEIAQMMEDETWFTAAEALEKGFCDVVTAKNDAENAIAMKFDFSRFVKSPIDTLTPRAEHMSNPVKPTNFITRIVALVAGLVAGGNTKPEDLQNQIAAEIESTISNLSKERDDAVAQVTDLTKERDDAKTEVTNITAECADFKTKFENAELMITKVKDQVKDQASVMAADILASLGVPPIEKETKPENQPTNSVAEAVAAYNAEKDPTKRGELWENVKAAWKKAV